MSSSSSAPVRDGNTEFWLDAPRYDQSTFAGRLRHFLNVIDPLTLFTSKEKLESSLQLLEDWKKGGARDTPVEELWKAKKIKDAIIHPDTGETVPMPFRMSGFVPFGVPIVVGLLLPNLSYGGTMFFQWANASHNALVNYYNRNASSHTSTRTFLESYAAASVTAMSVAVGLNMLVRKSANLSPAMKTVIQRFVPFPAVALSNVANVTLMRQEELKSGIAIFDKSGKYLGDSKKAAKQAITDTAVTRVALSFPVLVIPPIIISLVEKTKLWANNPRLRLPIQAVVCTAAFGGALPVAISIFPQQGSARCADIENELVSEYAPEDSIFYNKGL
mmetsp:Transcript_3795/g.11727  ORF Transcript_3795/g.11727 Transcript_3795/m.11727 type:complete len:332 (-) Transcript_3795:34-1029(-)|eukprot:CAMPEP_0177653342 /NCGR_PEP_ID=MMETSP0447-20121125/13684_1 /TAXON_ID=0 /ORGANISM="Stygamoeba regulata, Strain BSH-02190019" /LENGTH=331 /DNA_ID=CAMNT_0019156791 /DNA_START=687 /DNA_END=1682 /DNA_ORIENTATION=+